MDLILNQTLEEDHLQKVVRILVLQDYVTVMELLQVMLRDRDLTTKGR
jgi:hypothetical protein